MERIIARTETVLGQNFTAKEAKLLVDFCLLMLHASLGAGVVYLAEQLITTLFFYHLIVAVVMLEIIYWHRRFFKRHYTKR